MKRKRVTTSLNRKELAQLRAVMRYVRQMCGFTSRAEALRFLVRNWESP